MKIRCAESQKAWGGWRGGEFGEAAAQYAVLDAGEELRGVEAVVGDPVAVGAVDQGDQVVGSVGAIHLEHHMLG